VAKFKTDFCERGFRCAAKVVVFHLQTSSKHNDSTELRIGLAAVWPLCELCVSENGGRLDLKHKGAESTEIAAQANHPQIAQISPIRRLF
jgi:hypothetical protein